MTDPLTRIEACDQLLVVPKPLREQPRWVCWRGDKVPVTPDGNLANARNNDPLTWRDFNQAVSMFAADDSLSGVGIELHGGDLVVMDLDHCIGTDGQVEAWAVKLIQHCNSYTEISPSGTGVHVLMYGTMPNEGKHKAGNLELYGPDDYRYMTVTGKVWGGHLEVRSVNVAELREMMFPPTVTSNAASERSSPVSTSYEWQSSEELIDEMLDSRNGHDIRALLAGSLLHYPGRSEALAAVLAHLTFWTTDAAMIEGVLRRSGMDQTKWDTKRGGRTYIQQEIESALARSTEHYSPTQTYVQDIASRPEVVAEQVRGLVSMSALELADKDLPPISSLPVLGEPNIVVRGWSHIIAGSPKAGKTTLLGQVMGEWVAAGETVRYITEEGMQTWQYRVRNSISRDHLRGIALTFGMGEPPEALLRHAIDCPESVIVVDTIRSLLQFVDENDNSEAAKRLAGWTKGVCDAGKTLILVHHNRKGGGDHGEGISGGHAIFGVVDMGVMLTRDKVANRRKLETLGRIVEPVERLYEFDGKLLTMLGDPAMFEVASVMVLLLGVMRYGEHCTKREWVERLEEPRPSNSTVGRAIDELVEAHRVERSGEGRGVRATFALV